MRVYVASSWKNPHLDLVVSNLRKDGHFVYDFRETGFKWSAAGTGVELFTKSPTERNFMSLLGLTAAKQAFKADMNAFNDADVVLCVLPCNRSAHLELGLALGLKKSVILYHYQVPGDSSEPALELMYAHQGIKHAWTWSSVTWWLNCFEGEHERANKAKT